MSLNETVDYLLDRGPSHAAIALRRFIVERAIKPHARTKLPPLCDEISGTAIAYEDDRASDRAGSRWTWSVLPMSAGPRPAAWPFLVGHGEYHDSPGAAYVQIVDDGWIVSDLGSSAVESRRRHGRPVWPWRLRSAGSPMPHPWGWTSQSGQAMEVFGDRDGVIHARVIKRHCLDERIPTLSDLSEAVCRVILAGAAMIDGSVDRPFRNGHGVAVAGRVCAPLTDDPEANRIAKAYARKL